MRVWLIKPSVDTRDGSDVIRSRIGLSQSCEVITPDTDVYVRFLAIDPHPDVIIADESQFFTPEQIDAFRQIVDEHGVPVMCFGLRTDFLTKLFPGSLRLFEVADSIAEIKTICKCGSKATVNARISETGEVITKGSQVMLGGNDAYIAMCHRCYMNEIKKGNRQ